MANYVLKSIDSKKKTGSHTYCDSYFFRLVPLTLVVVFLFTSVAFAQWKQSTRLTFHDSVSTTSYNNARYVAADSDGFVHVVWFERNRELGRYNIYYKRSTDSGTSWSSDIRLSNDPDGYNFPSIAVSDGNVCLVGRWRMPASAFYASFMRSTDSGITWTDDTTFFGNIGANHPAIAVADSYVHLVFWSTYGSSRNRIGYLRSTDMGVTWDAMQMLLEEYNVRTLQPAIAVTDSHVHVVYWSFRMDQDFEIYYLRSTDYGTSWNSEPIRLTNAQGNSRHPSIVVSGTNNIHMVWQDNRDGNDEIYYKYSTNQGITWSADTRLTYASYDSHHPSIAVSGTNVHLVWQDNRDGNDEIYYKCSTDEGITWKPDVHLTNDIHWSIFPSIAIADTMVHVVWTDDRDGNPEIYYKRNPTGNY